MMDLYHLAKVELNQVKMVLHQAKAELRPGA
jgi:hypothetical protein